MGDIGGVHVRGASGGRARVVGGRPDAAIRVGRRLGAGEGEAKRGKKRKKETGIRGQTTSRGVLVLA